jgi:two-component system, OmpR family, alkaline phosphatase synthesis response regulator PhoP
MPDNVLIYIVDDEPNIRGLLSYNLQSAGFFTMEFENAENALAQTIAFPPHLMLLDLMLPVMDSIELCRRIRESETARDMPIIMLIARGEEFDQVLGLEIGVDDYITKPFNMSEVIVRIKALLRRSRHLKLELAETVFVVGNLSINLDQHMVTKNGNELIMPLKEFNLLLYMIENKGRVLTREQLLDHVWGYDYARENRTVDVHVWNLRKKVDNDPNHPALIETVRGIGYRFSAK